MAGKLTTAESAQTNLPQFSLRTMFLAITCLGVTFALLETIGMAASCAVLVAASLIALHIAGNALGTNLRDNAPVDTERSDASSNRLTAENISSAQFQSVSSLYRRARLGRIIYFATAAGAIAGCIVGDLLLKNSPSTTIRGLLLGAASCGVLGGFFGFLYGCFFRAWLGAWWQALSESDDCRKPCETSSFASDASVNPPPPNSP